MQIVVRIRRQEKVILAVAIQVYARVIAHRSAQELLVAFAFHYRALDKVFGCALRGTLAHRQTQVTLSARERVDSPERVPIFSV